MNPALPRWLSLVLTMFLVTAGAARGRAQEILKHPRVAELEDRLTANASDYIKTRFPSTPFIVTVRIDPLRRETAAASAKSDMPYFDPDDNEEIRDEWDDPQVPLHALINRVKRIQVSLMVPAKLQETEISELKQGLFEGLHLTPARDEISVSRRDWAMDDVPWLKIALIASVLLTGLVGLLIINRSSANRIARALGELKLQNQSASPAMTSAAKEPEAGSFARASQEVKFNDPIKMKELASRHVGFLLDSRKFPNHRDVFVLDQFGRENPAGLGAILAEFPAEMQTMLFSYSADFHWIEAMNAPGFMDFQCLETLQALVQNPRDGDDPDWNHAVLSVWRLNQDRAAFVRSLPKEDAFALLAEMPKAVAVAEARRSFPGAWAAILDPSFKTARPPASRLRDIKSAALKVRPLGDIGLVKRYRAERELLDYLRLVDPAEERDIYGASGEDALIHKLRAPFYVLFDQPAEVLREFVSRVSLETWAFALFNLPKADRSIVDAHFSDKQKFLLVEKLKKIDAAPPARSVLGSAREKVAAALRDHLKNTASAGTVREAEEDDDSSAVAA